ncbi:hypothetical protein [Aestuariispira insulae]|uniref:Uncharacterized protein n=1 Tax=Aestuariispira insulae TaxID=1461337 RepID=A0A3D9HDX0_9PROT|nr:hypothetical protein [Aestuariispira insulae]RED47667.1 hypothetical protein DFP90_10931 [Aestuariispira insulae]
MNFGEFLSSDLIIGALLLIMFLVMMRRLRKNPQLVKLEWDLAYDYVSEPRESDNGDFVATFTGDLPPHGEDVHLIRLAFLNKGRNKVSEGDFNGPVTITFAEGTDVISASYNDAVKTAPLENHKIQIDGNRLTIDPFSIESDGVLVFNLVAKGSSAAEPESLAGSLKEQEIIRRLGLKFRYVSKGK